MRKMKHVGNIARWAGLFVAVLFTVSFIFWGRGAQDPYYWLTEYASGDVTGSLSFGTVHVGHLWCKLFGSTLLGDRLHGWLCCTVAMTLPFLICFDSRDRREGKVWYSFTAAMFLMAYGTFNEFNPGTLSFLMMSVIVCLMYLFSRRLELKHAMLMGLVTALAIACRLPNVIAVAVCLTFITACMIQQKRAFPWIMLADFLYLAVLGAAYVVIFRIGRGTFNVLSVTLMDISGENNGTHSILDMMKNLFGGLNEILIDFSFITLLYCFMQIERRTTSRWHTIVLDVLVVAVMCYFLKNNIGTHVWHNFRLHVFTSSICIFVCFLYSLRLAGQRNWKDLIFILSAALVMFVIPLGSDTVWVKLFPPLLVILFLSLSRLDIDVRSSVLWCSLAVYVGYSLVCYANNNISKGTAESVFNMTEMTENAALRGVRLSKSDVQYLDQVCADFDRYALRDCTFFYGSPAHYHYVVTGSKPVVKDYPYWMDKNDSTVFGPMLNAAAEKSAFLFDLMNNDSESFHEILDEIDYATVYACDDYTIYKPKNESDICQQQ